MSVYNIAGLNAVQLITLGFLVGLGFAMAQTLWSFVITAVMKVRGK